MTQESEELYRSNLEGVLEFLKNVYGDSRRVLNIKDVAKYIGRSSKTAKGKYFKKDSKVITAENFARVLAKM